MSILDDIAIITYVFGFLTYMILFFIKLKKNHPAKYSVFQLIYNSWVENILEEETPLLGVHALRNFIRGNSTFISSLFILLGILIGFYSDITHNLEPLFHIEQLSVGLVQFSVTIGMLTFCLLNFILSLRYATRLSILITGKPRDYSIEQKKGFDLTKETLVNAQNHWMLGIRSLFFFATTFFWFLNPILFILITAIVTAYLIKTHEIL